jgi:RNA-directed DNA polymerase
MGETPSSQTVQTKLERIATMAKAIRGAPLTTLAHHIDVDWLREAYRQTRKDGARGVDGQSAKQYAEQLEENLRSLLDRAKTGTYRAPPVRRVNIPKGDGSQTRPIGIPTFEDKILQRAVKMLLEAIYETSFHDFSYGFRPNRSAHQACEALRDATMRMGGGWVLEVDIKGFFDTHHDHPVALAGQSPMVREAQQVEGSRPASPSLSRFGRWNATSRVLPGCRVSPYLPNRFSSTYSSVGGVETLTFILGGL